MEKCQYHEVKSEEEEETFSWKYFSRQLLISSSIWIAYLLGGLAQGSPTIIIPQLRREANSTEAVTEEMASWLSSAIGYSAAVWAIITPIIVTYIGQKITFIICSWAYFFSYLSFYFNVSFSHLIFTEVLQGLMLANQTTILIAMISEYTSPKYRGVFLTIKTATTAWGIWISNAMGTFLHWKTIGLLGIILSVYNCIIGFYWVESPYWLANKGRFEECAKSHRWLKGTTTTSEKELEQLISYQKVNASGHVKDLSNRHFLKHLWEDVKDKSFYRAFLICIPVLTLYHTSGKMVCAVYAIDIVKTITGKESTAYVGMLILDGFTVISMYAGCIISRFLRRRVMLITNSSIAVMFLFANALYLYLIKLSVIAENNYISMLLLIVFTLFISCGPYLFISSIYGELTPIKSRSLFIMFCGIYFDFLYGTMLKIAPLLFRIFKLHGTFFIFGVMSSVLIIVIYITLPETKDKTLVEIKNLILGEENKEDKEESSRMKLAKGEP